MAPPHPTTLARQLTRVAWELGATTCLLSHHLLPLVETTKAGSLLMVDHSVTEASVLILEVEAQVQALVACHLAIWVTAQRLQASLLPHLATRRRRQASAVLVLPPLPRATWRLPHRRTTLRLHRVTARQPRHHTLLPRPRVTRLPRPNTPHRHPTTARHRHLLVEPHRLRTALHRLNTARHHHNTVQQVPTMVVAVTAAPLHLQPRLSTARLALGTLLLVPLGTFLRLRPDTLLPRRDSRIRNGRRQARRTHLRRPSSRRRSMRLIHMM